MKSPGRSCRPLLMLRKSVISQPTHRSFRLRGHEVKRIEAFSDAVFAFAVTLLIVSLEVPRTFNELMVTVRGFAAFGLSFALLANIWYDQNIFFRKYNLDDITTVTLNCILIFVVLFYVYPLKFLFTLMFNEPANLPPGTHVIVQKDVPLLMSIYSGGYICIQLLFLLMHVHAYRKREQLELNISEIFDTRTRILSNMILIAIGLLSIIAAQLLPVGNAGLSGMIYFLIAPVLLMFHGRRARRRKALSHEGH